MSVFFFLLFLHELFDFSLCIAFDTKILQSTNIKM